jgi:hypothetical protein
LLNDHEHGPSEGRAAHYLEWATLVDGLSGQQAETRAQKLDAEDYSIHFHTWDTLSFLEYINAIRLKYSLALDLEIAIPVDIETIVIMRKSKQAHEKLKNSKSKKTTNSSPTVAVTKRPAPVKPKRSVRPS